MLRAVHKCTAVRIPFRQNHFDAAHLAKNDANYAQLSPLTAFNRTTKLFPHKPAYVYNNRETTYGQMGSRVAAFASGLQKLGVNQTRLFSMKPISLSLAWAPFCTASTHVLMQPPLPTSSATPKPKS